MSKKCCRFFGGLLDTQEKWLNKMSGMGYRLVRTGKMLYEFERCRPNEFQHRIDFIGEKSKADAEEYRRFLEDMGYKAFFKNINLNYSAGKLRWRPWAEKGGRIAANSTTFNRELPIAEKKNDGKPFELHTSYEDKARYYANLRNPRLMLFIFFGAFWAAQRSVPFLILGAISLVPTLIYHTRAMKNSREAKTREW